MTVWPRAAVRETLGRCGTTAKEDGLASVIACERLADHGELRVFLREGPPEHLAFEIFQEADGRAWTLRVPIADRVRLTRVVRAAAQRLARPEPLAVAADGTSVLAQEMLSIGDELVALVLVQEGRHAFALWRRERVRDGWAWTLDAVFAPYELAGAVCAEIEAVLARL